MKPIPLRVCEVCGGQWFRLVDYYEFLPEELLTWWPTKFLVGQITPGPMGVGVCLCGTPWTPELSAEPKLAVIRFLYSYLWASQVNDLMRAATASELAEQKAFDALCHRLKLLEGTVGRRMRPGRGRPWKSPTRKPASGGRDRLVVALQERGFSFREAREMVGGPPPMQPSR